MLGDILQKDRTSEVEIDEVHRVRHDRMGLAGFQDGDFEMAPHKVNQEQIKTGIDRFFPPIVFFSILLLDPLEKDGYSCTLAGGNIEYEILFFLRMHGAQQRMSGPERLPPRRKNRTSPTLSIE